MGDEENTTPTETESGGDAETTDSPMTATIGEMLAQGVRDDDVGQADPDVDDVDDVDEQLRAAMPPEEPSDELPDTKPEPEPDPEPEKPDEKPDDPEKPDEIEAAVDEAEKKGDPRANLAHKLARQKGQRLKSQEAELDQRMGQLEQQQQKFLQAQHQFYQQQQQFAQQLQTDPIAALRSMGQDPDLVLQQMSKQVIDGEAPKPQPWEQHIKQLEQKLAAMEQRDAEAQRTAMEQQRQAEHAGHVNTVISRMVGGPEMEGFAKRWPTFEKLTPVHREREARDALALAYRQGYEGPIDELLDHMEETLSVEYPYLSGGNGAAAGSASGRAQDARTESPPGNGTPADEDRPAATPDAVTGELAAENGSGNRRKLTERQRRAAARRYLSGGIIRE